LLTNFERKNKSILNSIKKDKPLRFAQEDEETVKKNPVVKKDGIDMDKWHEIKQNLDAPKFADFNM